MIMRVKDLREALVEMPDEAIVIIQVDDYSTGLEIVALIEPTDKLTGRPGVPEVLLS